MPRFVLLRHECPADHQKPSHWDFMLEQEGVLRTWELHDLPAAWARVLSTAEPVTTDGVTAIALPDHRLAYLEFEGPLTTGRGSVQRCDQGEYSTVRVDEDRLQVRLSGSLLRGNVDLKRGQSAWHMEVGS